MDQPNHTTNPNDELLQFMRSFQTELVSLRSEIKSLHDRVASLETIQPPRVIDEEIVCILSSTIAAYLGVKPRIRQIRLVSSESWAHQGRATIQASHALNR